MKCLKWLEPKWLLAALNWVVTSSISSNNDPDTAKQSTLCCVPCGPMCVSPFHSVCSFTGVPCVDKGQVVGCARATQSLAVRVVTLRRVQGSIRPFSKFNHRRQYCRHMTPQFWSSVVSLDVRAAACNEEVHIANIIDARRFPSSRKRHRESGSASLSCLN